MNQPNHPQSPADQPSQGGNPDEEDLIPLVPSSVPRTPNLGGRKKIPLARGDESGIQETTPPANSPVAISLPSTSPLSSAPEESSDAHGHPSDSPSDIIGQSFQPRGPGKAPEEDEFPIEMDSASAQTVDALLSSGATEAVPSSTGSQHPVTQPAAETNPELQPPPSKRDIAKSDDAQPADTGGIGLMPRDKTWLTVLLAGLLVVVGALYFFFRDGLPSGNAYQATLRPSLPIKGEKITVEDIELRWKDLGSPTLAANPGTSTLFPEAVVRFAPQSNGAVRLFFKNERDRQVGDTVNFEVRDGRVGEDNQNIVACTDGLRSRIEYDDLRARSNSNWTLEIWEGTDQLGPISGFTLLARVYFPWNLGAPIKKP